MMGPVPCPQPFLLIDVREPEEFAACHIAEAVNIPARMLSRDTIPPEIYRYVSTFRFVTSVVADGLWLASAQQAQCHDHLV
jgi:Rhodanese-like domain